MKTLGSFLLVIALLAPLTANAMNFVVAQSDVHPRPQVIGDLVAISATEMVVATQDGRVPLMMDSRTLVPTDLSVGNTIAVEFRVLDNGNYYANRVVPFRGTVPSYSGSTTSYNETYESHESMATPVAVNENHATTSTYTTTASEPIAQNETPAQTYSSSSDEPTTTATDDDELPSTASARPLMGLAGILVLAAASTMMLIRRRRLA